MGLSFRLPFRFFPLSSSRRIACRMERILFFLNFLVPLLCLVDGAASVGGCKCKPSEGIITCVKYVTWPVLSDCFNASTLVMKGFGPLYCDRINSSLISRFSRISLEDNTGFCNCFRVCFTSSSSIRKIDFDLCTPIQCQQEVNEITEKLITY